MTVIYSLALDGGVEYKISIWPKIKSYYCFFQEENQLGYETTSPTPQSEVQPISNTMMA